MKLFRLWIIASLSAFGLSGCAFWLDGAPVGPKAPEVYSAAPEYIIGPGDTLQVFVWRSAELSVTVPVRPDGRFSMPLLQDVQAAGKSPSQVSEEIKQGLTDFVRDPQVTVIVQTLQNTGVGKVTVVGEVGSAPGGAGAGGAGAGGGAVGATGPRSVPYRAGLTLLDVMVEVGGISQFANGNDSRLVRVVKGRPKEFRLRLADLLKDGDTTANVELAPGDVIRIPERWF